MKRTFLSIAGLAIAVLSGCSGPTTPTVNNPPQVNYAVQTKYVYTQQTLDANSGQRTGTVDTITATVVATNFAYQGKTNVTEFVNTHSNGSEPDTSYIAQDSGRFWHYNYGLESLNENSAVLAAIGKPVQDGWVLQAEFNVAAGASWVGADTSLSATFRGIPLHATLLDSVSETTDTNIVSVRSSTGTALNFAAGHAVHHVTLQGLSGSGQNDTYVSEQYGPVVDIVNPSTIQGMATPGRITVLIQAP